MATRLVNSDNLHEFRAQLSSARRIGVDTEFHAERRFIPLLLLLQIHVPHHDTWIVDPKRPNALRQIREELLACEWIVHGGKTDLVLLLEHLNGLPDVVWDTQIGAGLLELYYPSPYGRLITKYLGIVLNQDSTLSNWAKRPLSTTQIRYAAEDVTQLDELWTSISEQ